MLHQIGTKHGKLVLERTEYSVRHYRCTSCGTLQEAVTGDDGIERWRFTPYAWNIAQAKRLTRQAIERCTRLKKPAFEVVDG